MSSRKCVMVVIGTRPEAIKMIPVIRELQRHATVFDTRVCVTAQHREMLDQVLEIFAVKPDYDLNLMKPNQDLFTLTAEMLQGLKAVFTAAAPALVLVHGDTTTTMVASLAAFYLKIPVAHVEAGLRTGNLQAPWPEELNRRIASIVTAMHFAPTEAARANLLRENIAAASIYVTGNTIVDALHLALEKIRDEKLDTALETALVGRYPALAAVLGPGAVAPFILVTGHRRENFGEGFDNICRALRAIAQENPRTHIVYPVHLNPNVREPVLRILQGCSNVHLIEPLDYLAFMHLLSRCLFVITDSGGIQEEAPSLGKAVLLMRNVTERPEAVSGGAVTLVGTDFDLLVTHARRLLAQPATAQPVDYYGDGHAAVRIATAVSGFLHV